MTPAACGAFAPMGNGPGARLGFAAGEIALQAQQLVGFANQACKAAFGKAQLLHEHLGVFGVELGQRSASVFAQIGTGIWPSISGSSAPSWSSSTLAI